MHKIKLRLYPAVIAAALILALAPCDTAQAAAVRTPKADGTTAYSSAKAVIDASHTSDGYVMVKYTGTNAKVKLRIQKDTEYTYDIAASGNYGEIFAANIGEQTPIGLARGLNALWTQGGLMYAMPFR